MDKHINHKQAATIEFWTFIGCIILSFITVLSEGTSLRYALFPHLLAGAMYLAFYFYLGPVFEKDAPIARGPVFFTLAAAVAITLTATAPLHLCALLSVKLLLIYFNRHKNRRENLLAHETVLLFGLWLFTLSCCWLLNINRVIKIFFFLCPPQLIVAYLLAAYALAPWLWTQKQRKLRYFGCMFLVSTLSLLCVLLQIYLFESTGFTTSTGNIVIYHTDENAIVPGFVGTFILQMLLVRPVAWNAYRKRHQQTQTEIYTLKTELGQSDAHLNFLKSQINPHFLFNALNTLYGTALQEHAERTSEGIQKLGDMMRLMLQENMQDNILLTRDLEYLRNYISLQELRTATSPAITIETQIEDPERDLLITPMLLIPFVENAFKHGISLVNTSHIKTTLQTQGSTLYFDVQNSVHPKPENDPEKEHSGIGLENVKQRLLLLYPGKHELVIRENAREFFVHLTLQLTTIH